MQSNSHNCNSNNIDGNILNLPKFPSPLQSQDIVLSWWCCETSFQQLSGWARLLCGEKKNELNLSLPRMQINRLGLDLRARKVGSATVCLACPFAINVLTLSRDKRNDNEYGKCWLADPSSSSCWSFANRIDFRTCFLLVIYAVGAFKAPVGHSMHLSFWTSTGVDVELLFLTVDSGNNGRNYGR